MIGYVYTIDVMIIRRPNTLLRNHYTTAGVRMHSRYYSCCYMSGDISTIRIEGTLTTYVAESSFESLLLTVPMGYAYYSLFTCI